MRHETPVIVGTLLVGPKISASVHISGIIRPGFYLGQLNDHLFGKEIFIRFISRVLRGRLSICECFLRVGCGI